ncbi:aldehyde oxidase [Capnocytophaga sp. HP1101]
MNRRDFILRSSLAGAGAFIAGNIFANSSIISATDKPKKNQPLEFKKRKLGSLEVTELGFGCMNIAWAYGPSTPRPEAVKLIRAAYEAGIRFFDTAEIYGPFYSEEVVGEALKAVRNNAVIATKFGFDIHPDTKSVNGLNSRPEHIKAVVDRMLKRLQTDHIDLLYQHRIDPNVPIEDVAGTVGELVKAGKVLHLGLSEVGEATIRRAHSEFPVTAVQNEYSFWVRNAEMEVIPTCDELGIGFVPWSPLGMGYLTSKVTPAYQFQQGDIRKSLNFPRFTAEAIAKNQPVVAVLETMAKRKNATPAQIALAWLLARQPFIVPIPGTTKLSHLAENNQAINVQLTPADMQWLNEQYDQLQIVGDRAPESLKAAHDTGVNYGNPSKGTHGKTPLKK